MLSDGSKESEKLMSKYGYSKNELIRPDQVEALLFKQSKRSPDKIEVTEQGFSVQTMDDAI